MEDLEPKDPTEDIWPDPVEEPEDEVPGWAKQGNVLVMGDDPATFPVINTRSRQLNRKPTVRNPRLDEIAEESRNRKYRPSGHSLIR